MAKRPIIMESYQNILEAVETHPGQRITDLASITEMSQGNVSQRMNKLEEEKLVRKMEGKGRGGAVEVYLTEKGKKLVDLLNDR